MTINPAELPALALLTTTDDEHCQRWEVIATLTAQDRCPGCGASPEGEHGSEGWEWTGRGLAHRCSEGSPPLDAVSATKYQELTTAAARAERD